MDLIAKPGIRNRKAEVNLLGYGLGLQYFGGYINLNASAHRHNFLEMAYIIDGEATHVLGEDRCRQRAGSLSIINYNQQHSIVTTEGPIDVMNIYLDLGRYHLPDVPVELRGALQSIIPLHPLFGYKQNRIIHLELPQPKATGELLKAMLTEQEFERAGFVEAMNCYFKIFLMILCRAARDAGIGPNVGDLAAGDRKFEGLRQHLDGACASEISLEGLSRRMNMNKTYLCRKFKEYTGKTIFNYVLHKRLEKAMYLLRASDEKIVAIAIQSGFNDLSNFNKAFKSILKTTPSQYRKQQQAGVS